MQPILSSFGSHMNGVASNEGLKRSHKTHLLTKVAIAVSYIACTILLIPTVLNAIPCIFCISTFISASALLIGSETLKYRNICQTAGIIVDLNKVKSYKLAPFKGKCSAIPTEHSADTELWREELIKAAQHNIILSGNYCGGKAFIRYLDLIKTKLEENPNIKVIIISSPNFLSQEIKKKYNALEKQYPDSFSLVESPDIWHLSPGIKKSTNHTKCMVIDYGKYFILGGSGIKDNFVGTGLDDLTKEEFLEKRQLQSDDQVETEETSDTFMNQIIKKMVPGNFRDMDFVFGNSTPAFHTGKQIYKQMLLLSYRWEEYNKQLKKQSIDEDTPEFGVFTRKKNEIKEKDSVTVRLLKTPLPKKISTQVPSFDQHQHKSDEVKFKLYATGPEHIGSHFAQELVKKIKHAKNRIVIDHMYYHPTAELSKALQEAAERGVKITIITSGVHKGCPNSHYVFGPRNKYNYSQLVKSLPVKAKENVEIYEYQQYKKGSHKKLMIIDNDVIGGSSNFGYKSLVTTSDHELNFIARSKHFANETMKVVKVDIDHSVKIENPESITVSEIFKAAQHRLVAPLIG